MVSIQPAIDATSLTEHHYLPECPLRRPSGTPSLYTDKYSVTVAQSGVYEGVDSADLAAVADLGNRLIVLLGDVEGKGCLVPRGDQGEGLTEEELNLASSGAACAIRYREIFSEICSKEKDAILASKEPALTVIRTLFAALDGAGVSKSLDFALVVLDTNRDQLTAHFCGAGVAAFHDANGLMSRLAPNITPFYPNIFGVEKGTRLIDNKEQLSFRVEPGQRIVLATDGLERHREITPYEEGELLPPTPIERALAEMPRNASAAELLSCARNFAGCGMDGNGAPQLCHDDTALIIIQLNKTPVAPSLQTL